MTIETKIAKNGAVNIYLDGKRVKEEIAVDTLCDNGGKIYFADIHGYTGHTITATFASSISAYKWLIKMGNKSINYADGSWLIDCKDYKTGEIVTILEKDERDYVINDPQLKAFCNGEILEVTQEVVTDDAEQEPEVAKFEVGKTYFVILDGQTITAKVEDRTAKMLTATTNEGTRKYHIHETIDAEHINLNGEGLMIWAQCEFTTQNVNAAKAELQADTEPEVDTSEYAINPDAIDIAVDAEIQAANTAKINDLKWEIRYVEGSINDLDKNHIAHFPQDQSLKERRAELVNELAALKAQLADLLPNEIQVANNEAPKFKYYLQSRRPIAGAVPNGYISATQGEMKVHSLRSDGSISPVPRKVVFGVVVYDHPLSDQQIINYDLHVDPLNPKVEPDTTELSDEEIAEIKRRSQINAIKSRIATYERAIERHYDAELENSLIAAKAQLAEIEPANTPEADHITGIKEEQPMTNREKLLALRKEYIITDRLSANNSSMWYVNGKRSSQVKVWNLLQSYGLTIAEFLAENEAYINECIAASCKKIAIKKQADFLYDKIKRDAQPSGDNVFDLLPTLDQLNDVDDEIATPVDNRHKLIGKWNETLFNPEFKHGTAKMTFTMQGLKHQAKIVWSYISVGFDKGKYKFRMGSLLLGKYDTPAQVEKVIDLLKAAITRGDKAFTFPTVDELIDPPAEPYRPIAILNHNINWATETLATMQGDIYSDDWQDWTRSELEQAIEDWTEERDDLIIKSGKLTFNHQQKKNLRDSLERAKQIACKNIRVAHRNHNREAEDYERELYDICNQALKEVA